METILVKISFVDFYALVPVNEAENAVCSGVVIDNKLNFE